MSQKQTDITILLNSFSQFLSKSWTEVTAILPSEEEIDNWLQCNWEMLVETSVETLVKQPVRLQPYGNGADLEGGSSRVTFLSALPNHQIALSNRDETDSLDVLTGERVNLEDVEFSEFVAMRGDGWYERRPPFDHVLTFKLGVEVVLPVAGITFQVAAPRG